MPVIKNNTLTISTMGILAAAIFYFDTFRPLGLAGCVPYVLVILISLLLPQPYAPILAAIGCTVMTYGSMAFLPAGSEWGWMFLNRSLAVFAIWTTALLGSRVKEQIRTLEISELRLQRDISERKQVEQRQELQQNILKKIAEWQQSQSAVLNDLCLQVEQIMPSAICSIMVIDEITGTLKAVAVPSGGETAWTILDGLVPSEFGGACGTAVHTRTTVIIEDSETDPRWETIREAARPLGIKSCWSIPVFGKDQRILGTFAISYLQIQRPTPNDLQLLETASSMVSIALQRTHVMANLSESEKRYRDLYETAPLAYFTSHMDGRIKSANTCAVQLLGYSLEELIDRTVLDLYAPTKNGREKAQHLQRMTQTGKEIEAEELEMQRADETRIWISLTVRIIRNSQGNLIERRALVQDITARKKSEERLLLTKSVMDHAGDTILWAGPDKRIRYANTAATQSLGYAPEQLIGKLISDISPTHDPDIFTQKINALQQGQSFQYESSHRTSQGKEFPVEVSLSLHEQKGGPYTCAIVRDISDRKREEKLLATQKTILEMISTKQPLSDIFAHICLMIENQADHMYCSILLVKGNVLLHGAAPSLSEEYNRKVDRFPIGPNSASCGTAAYRNEPVIVANIATDPLWKEFRHIALEHGLQACWSTPIASVAGSVLATFAMYYEEPRVPNPENFKLIHIATSLASIALEQQIAEQALQQSEDRYRSLYEDNPTMYFTVALDGTVLSVNQFGASQLGYTVQEILQMPVWKLFLEEDHVCLKQRLEECLENPNELAHWEFRKIRKDGKIIWVRETVRVVKDHDNHSVFLIVCEDITQRKQAEELIRKGEKKFRAIYEQAPTGIATLDSLSGRFSQINQKYCDIVGYSQEEMFDLSFQELTHPDDLQTDLDQMQQLLAGKISTFQMEKRYFRKNGEVIWVNLTCVPLWGESTDTRQHIAMVEDITQRKQAEEKLQEMNMALSNAMPGIAQINPEGIYLEVNDSYADMLGYDPHELIRVSWELTVHPEDLPSAYAAYQEMLQTGKGEFEAKAIRKDKSTFYKHVLMVKKVDENGKLIGHHCFMRDISDRKLGEEALRESEGRLQGILDNSSAVMYVKDLQGHYLLINREYERIFNLDREKVNGKTDFDLFPYKIAKAFTENDQKVLDHGDSLEWEEVAPQKDGLHTYISNKFPLRNSQGTPYAICGISTDITQRKQAEVNIRLHNYILESSPNGILITDSQKPDNPITYCNAAFEKMTGYTQEEILGRNCRFLQKDDIDQDGLEQIRSALSKEQECEVVLRNYKKDGTPFWNDLRLAPVFDEKDTLNHYIGVLTDITERKIAESQLREAYNQTRELSVRLEAAEESERKRIARELHDEFGQMLTGLKFDLSWLQRRLSEQPSLTSCNIVLEKTRSMTNLTDDLIHMVRRIATSLRPSILDDLGLIPALEWHTKDFQKRTGIKCTFSSKLQGHFDALEGKQATALFRIAQELFTNVLRHAEASHVNLVIQNDLEFLTLSVRDNGRGFGEPQVSQLPSLGLLGIRERVASFGGDFQIKGKPGKGTHATVRIPLLEKQPA